MLSQVQGRTYANMFGFVERFITAKVLELTRDHWLGDQVALEALVRFTDEELKHQALFRRIEKMMADGMVPGYHFLPDPDEVAGAVLNKSNWAVLALILLFPGEPVLVGVGVSNAEQAHQATRVADGVIQGASMVRAIT